MSSNPLYSIGARLVDSDGKAERKIIQLTDDDIIIGPNVDLKGTSIFRGLMQCNGGIEVNGADANISGNLIAKNTLIGWAILISGIPTEKILSSNIENISVSESQKILKLTFNPELPAFIKNKARCLLFKFGLSNKASFDSIPAWELIDEYATINWGDGSSGNKAVLLVVG